MTYFFNVIEMIATKKIAKLNAISKIFDQPFVWLALIYHLTADQMRGRHLGEGEFVDATMLRQSKKAIDESNRCFDYSINILLQLCGCRHADKSRSFN